MKTSAGQLAVGSNPTPSVGEGFKNWYFRLSGQFNLPIWRGARAVESGSLLRSCMGDCTEGSNPSLSEGKRRIVLNLSAFKNVEGFETSERRPKRPDSRT